MKYRTTKKEVNNGYTNKICVGYCALQNLLNRVPPVAYTTRREGWAADIYEFRNTAIITGYAPFGNIRPAYEVVKEYDEKAEKIRYETRFDWNKQTKQLEKLLNEFIQEVTTK